MTHGNLHDDVRAHPAETWTWQGDPRRRATTPRCYDFLAELGPGRLKPGGAASESCLPTPGRPRERGLASLGLGTRGGLIPVKGPFTHSSSLTMTSRNGVVSPRRREIYCVKFSRLRGHNVRISESGSSPEERHNVRVPDVLPRGATQRPRA